ncbi:MAG TPA: hypothetical protein QGF63_02650 [Alphaproteobacteria bacterium]|jgi:hypothetical protein|nr:hypothetical protein [Alphaproteobacteria bacterium]MDP6270969.1 hypothetical protein [Alphaproteobacteria bacterium]MDP7429831.1 hypothetical protein [Alphaproteobacteria bacterium]HJM48727.1 hypothetical protein [Alphaproteobacteria bacterium]|tara:strand:+ start:365 stop:508 length:144 start_codon:yes stop_codon:yes gene_type:complete
MKIRLAAVLMGFALLLGGCENMNQWTEMFRDINQSLIPIGVLKKAGN